MQRCVACKVEARCIHDRTRLQWADDSWICPKCGDEWNADETFGRCEPHPLPEPDLSARWNRQSDFTDALGISWVRITSSEFKECLDAYCAAYRAARDEVIKEVTR